MISIEIGGHSDDSDDFLKGIAEEVEGRFEVDQSDLFTPAFVQVNTGHATFEAFVRASGFAATPEEFESAPKAQRDEYVAKVTSAPSYRALQERAADAWLKRQGHV